MVGQERNWLPKSPVNSAPLHPWVFTAPQCDTVNFAAKIDFGTGSFPHSVAVGDFNGDSKRDLAVANQGSNTVSILLGTGAGSFGPKTDFGTGSSPFSVAVGDFNGDGKQDIVTANQSGNSVSVLLRNAGNTSFEPKVDFAVGSGSWSVAVGDFDRDNKLDLVTANGNSNTVSILLGTGTGSFGPKTDFGTGFVPRSVVVSDFNGDSRLDLAVANQGSDTVSILRGTGTGSFEPKTDFGTGSWPTSVAVGDFDGDSRLDLATANYFGFTVSILRGTGTSSFGPKNDFSTGMWPESLGVGDFNGDGKLDLAVTRGEFGFTVSILPGTGTGSFGPKTDFGTGLVPRSVGVGDFNGDSKLDLATANMNNNTVSILLNNCSSASPAELAKQVVGGDYQLGAKGWDWASSFFVGPNAVHTSGYHWNTNNHVVVDNVLDCSGLVFWSYNKAFGATKFQRTGNPVFYENADGQYRNNTVAVSESELTPGDLLFFDFEAPVGVIDHVAMYVGCCGPNGADDVVSASSQTVGITWRRKNNLKALTGFVGYGRVTTPKIGVRFTAHSPIGLIVTDPEGFTITPDTLITTSEELLREVPGILYYSESDIDGDGSLGANVYAPSLKIGSYLIHVIPKPDALPTDTYSLTVEAEGKTITLAENVLVQNIPPEGYGVASTGADMMAFVPVTIDIKPGGTPNSINSSSRGNIPVAILSSATFYAPGRIASASLTFGRTGDEPSLLFCNQEDANGDGFADLVCHFSTANTGFLIGDKRGFLKGQTREGSPLMGNDSVRIVH